MKFEDLKVIEPILKALQNKGYKEATPIQNKAIPVVLQRKDVLGCAQTGTGKTAAFSIPMIQLIHQRMDANAPAKIRGLIVTPTRELAIQIDENIKAYAAHTNVKHAVIFGGVKQGKQVERIKRGVHIVVATPGRLLDLIGQGYIHLNDVKMFVLDEADRMLDMGFINDINKLLKLLPKERQSLFFSATMPDNIVKLSRSILKDPIKIEVAPVSSAAETVNQLVYYTNRNLKKELLFHILNERPDSQALVFTRTKHGADRVARGLKKSKIDALAIHGDKAQNQRQRALGLFKDKKVRVLVATDIAARGIDIDKLELVINYEIPNLPETYVHRIGRTGRAGESGTSISISEPEENAFIKDIEKLISRKITIVNDHPFGQTDKPMTEEEKKEWNKEKQRRKMEFIQKRREQKSNRNKPKKENSSTKPNKPSNKRKPKPKPQVEKNLKKETAENNNSAKPKESDNRRNKNDGSRRRKSNTSVSSKLPPKLKNKFMWPLD